MLHIADAEIGGARVRRLFQEGKFRAGMTLTGDEVRAMANRKALIEQGYIEVWPGLSPDVGEALAERHIVHNGGGRYDVIAGVKLNTAALSKDEAEELATRPA